MIHGSYSQTGELQIASVDRETVRRNCFAGSYALIESRSNPQFIKEEKYEEIRLFADDSYVGVGHERHRICSLRGLP